MSQPNIQAERADAYNEFIQLRYDDEKFAEQYDETDFEEWLEEMQ